MNKREFQLVAEKAREGDHESLSALCAGAHPEVLRYMRYRVGSSDSEDLAAEVLLRVVRSIGTLRGSLVAWLYRIAANVVKDHYSLRSRKREIQLNELEDERQDSTEKPADAVAARLDLESALHLLTDDQRQIVTLRFMQGLSTIEAAGAMERTPGAVRVLQFRALAALRERLRSQGGSP